MIARYGATIKQRPKVSKFWAIKLMHSPENVLSMRHQVEHTRNFNGPNSSEHLFEQGTKSIALQWQLMPRSVAS